MKQLYYVHANGNNFSVFLKGTGIHPDDQDWKVEWNVFPPNSLTIPDVNPIVFSDQLLFLDEIPVFSIFDRIIYIRNTGDCIYQYETVIPFDIVDVHPSTGSLSPGECKKIILTIKAPHVPSIFKSSISFNFKVPKQTIQEINLEQSQHFETEEQIIAIDPPLDLRARSALRKSTKMQDWQSIASRTLTTKQSANSSVSGLFSTHIGKRTVSVDGNQFQCDRSLLQYIDIVFFAMSKDDYISKYVSMEEFYFAADNANEIDFQQHKEEITEVLGSIVDDVLSNPIVRHQSMVNAEDRLSHIPLFSQLYKNEPIIDLKEAPHLEKSTADVFKDTLISIIDEIIDDTNIGKFNLNKQIIQLNGYQANK